MQEENKKLALLSDLNTITDNNCCNNTVHDYTFNSVNTIIINKVCHYINEKEVVKIILFIDEILVEVYNNDNVVKSFSLPYEFITEFIIILGDEDIVKT